MASGKSLELKKFDEEHSEQHRAKELCRCMKIWESDVHFTKDGKLRANIAKDINHVPTGYQGVLRKAIAAHQSGRKVMRAKKGDR